ncbi:MAG: hypothetical protein E6K17_09215 [Methanobacteriota archaeon]|nr:MAG: hypothetical protein E6K17_09215 [Euryarchaeota archaeon]
MAIVARYRKSSSDLGGVRIVPIMKSAAKRTAGTVAAVRALCRAIRSICFSGSDVSGDMPRITL